MEKKSALAQRRDRLLAQYNFAGGVTPQGWNNIAVPAAAQQADIDDLSKPRRTMSDGKILVGYHPRAIWPPLVPIIPEISCV